MLIIINGWSPYPLGLYLILGAAVLRTLSLFFLVTPAQAARLSSVPAVIGWALTLLNVISRTAIGDVLSVLVDWVFFALRSYTRFRFGMVVTKDHVDTSSSSATRLRTSPISTTQRCWRQCL